MKICQQLLLEDRRHSENFDHAHNSCLRYKLIRRCNSFSHGSFKKAEARMREFAGDTVLREKLIAGFLLKHFSGFAKHQESAMYGLD